MTRHCPAGKRSIALSCALLLISLGASACSLKRDLPEKTYYMLEVERKSPAAPLANELRLYVGHMEIEPAFEGKGFVYRKANGTMQSDFYHEFFSTPTELITSATRSWFDGTGSGLEPIVLRPGMSGNATHVLNGWVKALYGDFHEDPRAAVIEIEFLLSARVGKERRLLFRETYREQSPFEGKDPEAIVKAWNATLTRILERLESDLREIELFPGENQ